MLRQGTYDAGEVRRLQVLIEVSLARSIKSARFNHAVYFCKHLVNLLRIEAFIKYHGRYGQTKLVIGERQLFNTGASNWHIPLVSRPYVHTNRINTFLKKMLEK